MNFDESVQYLFALGNEVSAMKLGLESIRKVLAELGNPQSNYLKVQVAGTNGKGSVCAFLDAICRSASIKTGLYTSPHLVSITERVKINGADISEDDFARHATRIREVSERLVADRKLEFVPTFFEQLTAIALNAFAESDVELAILETGLGGRLDAATAANAEIAAVTQIAYDHQKILGETLAKIAAEKAAIIRSDSKVVVGEQQPEAMDTIANFCANIGVEPRLASTVRTLQVVGETKASEPRAAANGSFSPAASPTIEFETSSAAYPSVRLGLLGRHQIGNAKVAILLAETLQEYFEISTEDIVRGLETAVHPGRLEFCGQFLFDGAHNIAGAKALRGFLDEFVTGPITMLFGAMRDKDIAEIADILFPRAANLILTRPENERSADPAEIAPCAAMVSNLFLAASVPEALRLARQLTPETGVILVTGSLYLIGEVKKLLKTEDLVLTG